jgi:F-type H+-transporting ATPase subunit b
MFSLFTQFGSSSSSGIGALGFNGQAFLIQLVTFIIALLVLRKWAFKPILKVMNERRETIEKGVLLGEQMQKEQLKMETKVEQVLHDSRVKADAIIREAEDQARAKVRAAEDQAKDRTNDILKSAEDRIKQETIQARRQLEKEVVNLIADTTEVVIKEKVDSKKDNELIKRALKEVEA